MKKMLSKKTVSRLTAVALALSLAAPQVAVSTVSAKGTAAPKLSVTSQTLETGGNFTLKVSGKKIVSTSWSNTNTAILSLSGQSKTSVVVTATDTEGTANVTAKVKYKTKVKKKKKKKTVTKTKTLNCFITVNKKQPVPETTVTPVFNATTGAFEFTFQNARANVTAPTAQDANGSSWTGDAAASVAKIINPANTGYIHPITNVVLSADGMKLTITVDLSSLSNGVKYTVALTGFYKVLEGAPAAASTTEYPMTTETSGIPLMINPTRTKAYYYDVATYFIKLNNYTTNPTTFDSMTDNIIKKDGKDVKWIDYYIGTWTSSASKVLTVTDLSTNQKVAVTKIAAQGTGKTNIDGIHVWLSEVPAANKQYRFDLIGFQPTAGGASTALTWTATFSGDGTMMKTNAKAQKLSKTEKREGMDTNYVITFDVPGYTGRGEILKNGGTGSKAPSTHLKVTATVDGFLSDSTKDISSSISYIKSTKGSSKIEIGIKYSSTLKKFVLSFKDTFPDAFLALSNDVTLKPGADLTIDKVS